MTRSITIEHEGETYSGQVMRIKSTMLGQEDHGIWSFMLYCEAPGSGIGVGGFCLDTPVKVDGKHSHREGTAYGLDLLMRVCETAGVYSWEKLPGLDIIVLYEGEQRGGFWGSTSVGFAHVTDEKKVLILKKHHEKWVAAHPEMEKVDA